MCCTITFEAKINNFSQENIDFSHWGQKCIITKLHFFQILAHCVQRTAEFGRHIIFDLLKILSHLPEEGHETASDGPDKKSPILW